MKRIGEAMQMKNNINHFGWEKGFPPVYGHTSIAFLKSCPGFYEAKNGNMQSALAVVNLCVKQSRLLELREKYPDCTLLPVMRKNKLPEALAKKIGLKIHTGIRIADNLERKKMSRMQRLLFKPDFVGQITENEKYILVDDIVSQGGTVSALRKYVLDRGGTICAVSALAYSAINCNIAPVPESIHKLSDRFDCIQIADTLRNHLILSDISELTNSEINYLLSFKATNKIIDKVNSCMLNQKAA